MEKLIDIYTRLVLKERSELPELLEDENLNQKAVLSYAWTTFFREGLYHFLVEEEFQKAKQSFFTSAQFDIYNAKTYEIDLLSYAMDHVNVALLSDAPVISLEYPKLLETINPDRLSKGSIIYALLYAWAGDMTGFQQQVELLKKYELPKKKGKVIAPDILFFEGLLEESASKVEEAISTLLTPKQHRTRNLNYGIANEYISIPAIGYAKLAVIRGFDIAIDHPLLPLNLLKVNPNKEYHNEFDFLGNYDPKPNVSSQPEVRYEEADSYKTQNPTTNNEVINLITVLDFVQRALPGYSSEEHRKITDLIWDIYSNPLSVDQLHPDYSRNSLGSAGSKGKDGVMTFPARPFLNEYNYFDTDSEWFEFAIDFVLHHELDGDEETLAPLMSELRKKLARLQ